MAPTRVVVSGARGKMGQEIISALCREPDIEVVGATELETSQDQLPLPDGSGTVPFSADLDRVLTTCHPEVLVDFTIARATRSAVPIATGHGVNLVIGTTGLTSDDLAEIDRLAIAHRVGAIVAPNFALGAVLMMHLAQIAARYMDCGEIIELHHDQKADSPSGTALTTAKLMAEARGKPFHLSPQQQTPAESRGKTVEGINIHSVRLPGLVAHQEVVFGGLGQTLSIRHDTISRQCFLPGVILAIKQASQHQGLVYGLDKLLGL
ncbi:MAG: 4-hydroxy-tetrahydrodipicolinate reductase [Chloroflexota bacterium]